MSRHEVLEYLRKLKLSISEVDSVCENFPDVLEMNLSEIEEKIELVISLGYPREDISSLVAVNPTFLSSSVNDLRETLMALDDVEEALKENPFII